MNAQLTKFTGMYRGFFRRSHYRGHEQEEAAARQRIQEQLTDGTNLLESPIVMDPVEAVGETKDHPELLKMADDLSIDDLIVQADRFYRGSFITKAFFLFALSRYLAGSTDIEQIANEAKDYLNIRGKYSIGKFHNPVEGENAALLLDWHDTLLVGGELRPFLTRFLRERKEMGYSLIVTSATYNLMTELDDKAFTDMIDAAYEIPALVPMPSDDMPFIDVGRSGKLYTDICKKLNISSSNAVILTDAVLDRSVENSYPIVTLVTPTDASVGVWEAIFKYFDSEDISNIAEATNRLRTSPVRIHNNDMRQYEVNGVRLYRHPSLYNSYFIDRVTPQDLALANLRSLD